MIYAGVVLAYTGDIDEGLRWIEKLIRHDPLAVEAYQEAALETFYIARRYDDAIDSVTGSRNLSGAGVRFPVSSNRPASSSAATQCQ